MGLRSKSWASAAAALLALAFAGDAHAAPRVLALFPVGGQRGTTFPVTLEGEGLKNLSGTLVFGPGVSMRFEPGGDDKKRTVTVSIAADAPLGRREIRFHDADDVSNARYFMVGAWPETAEVEPNNTPDRLTPLTLPATVNGRIHEYTEVDGYTFSARRGETIVCEIHGLRAMGQVGESWLKGYLEVTDAAGKVLGSSQGTSDDYYRWDPVVSFTAPADGAYRVWFRDLNYRGDARAVYRLTVGAVPHASAIFPLGGRRGTTVPVRFFGPHAGGQPRDVVIPTDAPDFLSISLTAAVGETNARPFQVGDWPELFQKDGNDRRETAQEVAFPSVVNGRFTPDRADHYRFTLTQPATAMLEVFSRRVGTPADPEITLTDAQGTVLQADDDAKGRDAGFLRALAPGTYVVSVREAMGRGGDDYPYRLSLTPPKPALKATASPDSVRVARGGTVKLRIHVDRLDTADGEVVVTLESAAPGLSAGPLTLAKGVADGELEVRAAADAPAGKPVALRLRASLGALTAVLSGSETYNIQGTAFQRDMIGPVVFVAEK